jgi:hypothetical protein
VSGEFSSLTPVLQLYQRHRDSVHGIPAVDQLAVLVALANAAPDDDHLASIAVAFFEPLVDLYTPEGWRGEIELRAGTRLKTRFPDRSSLTEVQAHVESSVNESGLSATWSRLDDGSWRGEFSVASG